MEKLYKCKICNKKEIYPNNFYGRLECKDCNTELTFIRKICPICKKALYKKHEGLACKNHSCPLYFKLACGWIYIDPKDKNNYKYFKDEYDFDLNKFENRKKWLLLKEKVLNLRERKCEICNSPMSLHVHHIIPRSESFLLTFDEENLMVLCERCHKIMHCNDKYFFGSKFEGIKNE